MNTCSKALSNGYKWGMSTPTSSTISFSIWSKMEDLEYMTINTDINNINCMTINNNRNACERIISSAFRTPISWRSEMEKGSCNCLQFHLRRKCTLSTLIGVTCTISTRYVISETNSLVATSGPEGFFNRTNIGYDWFADPNRQPSRQPALAFSYFMWKIGISSFRATEDEFRSALHQQHVFHVLVYPNGEVLFVPNIAMKTYCQYDLTHWPLDGQECIIKFGSSVYKEISLNISLYNEMKNVVSLHLSLC